MKATYIDLGDGIVEVPWANVEGKQKMADGSWRFKLVGGQYHDMTVRVFPPCDRIVFDTNNGPLVYEITPPVRKGGKWVYIHNPEGDTSPMETVKIMRTEEQW